MTAMAVRHVDLAAPDPAVAAADGPVLAVLWWRDLVLGAVPFRAEQLPCPTARVLDLAAPMIADQVIARDPRFGGLPHGGYDGRPEQSVGLYAVLGASDLLGVMEALATRPAPATDGLSVVICTQDRADSLSRCLASLAAQRQAPGEIVVVDNSATGSAAATCRAFPQVRYVHEPRPGLSVARNRGLSEVRRDLVAFTDDDVELHPGWTGALVAAFDAAEVDAVTGVVLPAVLDTPAQNAFEHQLGGFTQHFVPILFDGRFFDETLAAGPQVWRIGAGANMAFRRSVFDRVGGFDERLGAGAAGCSEDSEIWYRILAAGGACLYDPRAVVFHHHRADWGGLRRQVRAYIRGHVAALVVQADRHGHQGNLRRIFLQFPQYFLWVAFEALKTRPPGRFAILWDEMVGWAAGLRYVADRTWRARTPRQAAEAPHG